MFARLRALATNTNNLALNAFRPSFLPEMLHKLWERYDDQRRGSVAPLALEWCVQQAEPMAALLDDLDSALWQEALEFTARLKREAAATLTNVPVRFGGGGNYPLLYFLVRWAGPNTVLETGVAAGYSSRAILEALRANGAGRLISSDFPYFRQRRPERYIGVLVPQELRRDWLLLLEGDRANLRRILPETSAIDLVHYDSSKTYVGRASFMNAVAPKLPPGAIVIMDDIQDNLFFRDWVTVRRIPFRVFEFEGKYQGVIGLP